MLYEPLIFVHQIHRSDLVLPEFNVPYDSLAASTRNYVLENKEIVQAIAHFVTVGRLLSDFSG